MNLVILCRRIAVAVVALLVLVACAAPAQNPPQQGGVESEWDLKKLLDSLTSGARRLEPTLKLDYPAVPPEVAASWVDEGSRALALQVAEDACAAVGTSKLTYLGVRLRAGDDVVKLKYYVDLPRTRR